MKYSHPSGLEEPVIATVMRDVLRALEYIHQQGGIHRDVKVGNAEDEYTAECRAPSSWSLPPSEL